jgi:hypothetical protein
VIINIANITAAEPSFSARLGNHDSDTPSILLPLDIWFGTQYYGSNIRCYLHVRNSLPDGNFLVTASLRGITRAGYFYSMSKTLLQKILDSGFLRDTGDKSLMRLLAAESVNVVLFLYVLFCLAALIVELVKGQPIVMPELPRWAAIVVISAFATKMAQAFIERFLPGAVDSGTSTGSVTEDKDTTDAN